MEVDDIIEREETMPAFSVRQLIGENLKENSENNLFDNIPEKGLSTILILNSQKN